MDARVDDYLDDGERKALALGNRGPIRFERDGTLHRDIHDAFALHGFYVLEGVIDDAQVSELRTAVAHVLSRAPVTRGADVDKDGNPPIGADLAGPSFSFARPLTDPLGGTDMLQGRHPVKMSEPAPAGDAPAYTIELILNNLRLMDACLVLYGHPDLLRVAENVVGADFLPFNETVFVKEPGLGASVAWHQDGTTYWNSPDLDELSHGYNYQVQLYNCTPANALWVLPGSHRQGKADIPALMAHAQGDRLPGAVPIICQAGDVSMCNRQAVHGSFANTSSDRRWSITYGFLPRHRVAGVTNKKLNGELDTYDEQRIHERSRMIPLAVDARRQANPQETSYDYQPCRDEEDDNRWNEAARARVRNYNLLNVHI